MNPKQKEAILKYWEKNGPSLLDFRLRNIYGITEFSDWNEFRIMLVDYLGGISEVDNLIMSRVSEPFKSKCGGYNFDFIVKNYNIEKESNDHDVYMMDEVFAVIDPSGTARLFDGIEYTLFDLQHMTPTELSKKYGSGLDNMDLDEIYYELIECVKKTLYSEITLKYGVEIGGDLDIEEGKSQDFQSGITENIEKIKKIMLS